MSDDADKYVMSVNLPVNQTTEARLMSPQVQTNQLQEQGCLSFVIHFDLDIVNVTVGYTSASTPDDQQLLADYVTLGYLLYPFDTRLLADGDNSRLFRIRINVTLTSTKAQQVMRFVFIASGGGGSVSVWDIKYNNSVCSNSSK